MQSSFQFRVNGVGALSAVGAGMGLGIWSIFSSIAGTVNAVARNSGSDASQPLRPGPIHPGGCSALTFGKQKLFSAIT